MHLLAGITLVLVTVAFVHSKPIIPEMNNFNAAIPSLHLPQVNHFNQSIFTPNYCTFV
jgi:hypothetical protein